MPKPKHLVAVEHDKRATKDIPIFVDDDLYNNLEDIIRTIEWPYKEKPKLVMRDKALVALLILTGLRITEALRLTRKQFKIYDKHILLVNVETVKHGELRERIILPKEGNLARFTEIFETWLNQMPEEKGDSVIFPSANCQGIFDYKKPLSRYRVHEIIQTTTGKFPHWFRAVAENIYGRKVFRNNPYKLKDFMGLVNLNSTDPYVQATWEEDENRIYEL